MVFLFYEWFQYRKMHHEEFSQIEDLSSASIDNEKNGFGSHSLVKVEIDSGLKITDMSQERGLTQ
jgi:hypothetical protein